MAMIRIAWKSRAIASRQMVEVGFSKNCAQHIRDVSLFAQTDLGSPWAMRSSRFRWSASSTFATLPWRLSAAQFYGVSAAKFERRCRIFEGIARRQEFRGEARGVKVIDDFGHHPTAIAQTLHGAAASFSRASALGDL